MRVHSGHLMFCVQLKDGHELSEDEFVHGVMGNPEMVKRIGFADDDNGPNGFKVERKGISVGFMSRSWQMVSHRLTD